MNKSKKDENERTGFSTLNKGIIWLKKLESTKLTNWIEESLRFDYFFPITIYASSQFKKMVILINLLKRKIGFTGLLNEIKKIIGDLIIHYDDNEDKNYVYFKTLIKLCYKYKLYKSPEIYNDLLERIVKQEFINKWGYHKENIQMFLIKSVFSMENPIYLKKLTNLCEDLLKTVEFSCLAYRKLWEIKPENGIIYLIDIIRAHLQNENVDMYKAVERYLKIRHLKEEWFFKFFKEKYPNYMNNEKEIIYDFVMMYFTEYETAIEKALTYNIFNTTEIPSGNKIIYKVSQHLAIPLSDEFISKYNSFNAI